MKFSTFATAASLTLALLALPMLAKAALPTIFSTGVDAFGIPLPLGAADNHYLSFTTGIQARVLDDQHAPTPYAQSPTSRWIWDTSDGNGTGFHTFQTSFFVTPAQVASGLLLTGSFAADNLANVYLNNGTTSIGTTTNGVNGNQGFLTFAGFSASSGFIAGTNTLNFVVNNQGGEGGLNVDRVSLTATSAPEPGTLALLAFGISGGIAVRRRKVTVSQ